MFCSESQNYGGVSGAGASHYIMNCNVSIQTQDLAIGRDIAQKLRASTQGGLPGLQTMAFAHQGNIEIACNVESITTDAFDRCDKDDNFAVEVVPSFGNLVYVSPYCIRNRVKLLASVHGVTTSEHVIAGFTPNEARTLAEKALQTEQYDYWKPRQGNTMWSTPQNVERDVLWRCAQVTN